MRVFLIRHPQPLIEPGVCYGRLDVDADMDHLRTTSERLAARLAGEVPTLPIAAAAALTPHPLRIVASPARRCRGLADALAATFGLTPHYDERLLEKDFGDWEGRRWDDIDPQLIDAWAADLMHFVPPGGESVAAMRARALACAAEWTSAPAARDLVLVTHAGVIRVLLGHWLGLPLAEWSTLKLEFGALTRVDFVGASSPPALGSGAGKYGAVLHTLNG